MTGAAAARKRMALSIRFCSSCAICRRSASTVGSGPWVTLAPLSRMLAARSLSTPWTRSVTFTASMFRSCRPTRE